MRVSFLFLGFACFIFFVQKQLHFYLFFLFWFAFHSHTHIRTHNFTRTLKFDPGLACWFWFYTLWPALISTMRCVVCFVCLSDLGLACWFWFYTHTHTGFGLHFISIHTFAHIWTGTSLNGTSGPFDPLWFPRCDALFVCFVCLSDPGLAYWFWFYTFAHIWPGTSLLVLVLHTHTHTHCCKFLRVFRSKNVNQRHWTRIGEDDSSKLRCFTPEKLKRWFNFLVDNIYLQFSKDKSLRQRIGVPMGTNCAVFVANLFCFTYEFDFISRLIEQNRLDVVSQFRFTIRFVDDLLSCDNPIFDRYLYYSQTDSSGMRGIYPSFLALKREQMSDVEVSFLNVLIYRAGDVFSTKIFDKREHPPLSSISKLKYPHPSCFLSGRSKLGIVTSRLWCFGRICKRKCDFKARAKKFCSEFLKRGYASGRVRAFVVRFLRKVPLAFPVENVISFAKSLISMQFVSLIFSLNWHLH